MFFFFNDTAPTEIYTLSLHDAFPIWADLGHVVGGGPGQRPPARGVAYLGHAGAPPAPRHPPRARPGQRLGHVPRTDRKSTRLNSSHANISYAVFCLKKKNNTLYPIPL